MPQDAIEELAISNPTELHQIKHDIFDILVTVQGLLEIGRADKALAMIRKATVDLTDSLTYSPCKNEIINTVLSIKRVQAKKLGVNLILTLEETAKLQMDDYDVCRLLSNLLNNALYAASHLPLERNVYFSIQITETHIQIHSKNKCLPPSAKTFDESHGHGTDIIRNICRLYSGKYYTYIKNNTFVSETVLQNKAVTPPPNFRSSLMLCALRFCSFRSFLSFFRFRFKNAHLPLLS